MRGKFLIVGLCGASLAGSVGCTSMRSIMLHRDESNTAWEKERHLPGVPITLKVLTHVKITVTEKHYLASNQVGGVTTVSRVDLPVPVRGVSHELIYTDKIFTVDFKRPAAGVIDANLKFKSGEQYFDSIDYHVEDKTIDAVANLITKVAPGGLFKSAAEDASLPSVQAVESVVAVKIFEVESPDLEQQISAFLECHVNKSHDAWVVPPGVNEIRRLPLTVQAGDNVRPPLCQGPGCEPSTEQIDVRSTGQALEQIPKP